MLFARRNASPATTISNGKSTFPLQMWLYVKTHFFKRLINRKYHLSSKYSWHFKTETNNSLSCHKDVQKKVQKGTHRVQLFVSSPLQNRGGFDYQYHEVCINLSNLHKTFSIQNSISIPIFWHFLTYQRHWKQVFKENPEPYHFQKELKINTSRSNTILVFSFNTNITEMSYFGWSAWVTSYLMWGSDGITKKDKPTHTFQHQIS